MMKRIASFALIATVLALGGCYHHYHDDDGGWRDRDRDHRYYRDRGDRDDDGYRYRERHQRDRYYRDRDDD
ncbi:hypothetical protein M9Y57_10015 [Pseudomonas putida]|nr:MULTISPECIES: hypothetical protein [Pseudomonas]MCL8305227.1 hypothetical protein [Pseudomonas putida]